MQQTITFLYYGGWTCVWIGVAGVVDLVGLFLWAIFHIAA
jgi:hypothetical protein